METFVRWKWQIDQIFSCFFNIFYVFCQYIWQDLSIVKRVCAIRTNSLWNAKTCCAAFITANIVFEKIKSHEYLNNLAFTYLIICKKTLLSLTFGAWIWIFNHIFSLLRGWHSNHNFMKFVSLECSEARWLHLFGLESDEMLF